MNLLRCFPQRTYIITSDGLLSIGFLKKEGEIEGCCIQS